MKKFVSVNELSFGVYVTQLDRPWTETPFVFQGFLLNSEAQLATLQKFCNSVRIDTEKGADIKSTPAGGATFTVLQSIRQKVTYEEKIEVNVELPVANGTPGVDQDHSSPNRRIRFDPVWQSA